MEKFIASLCSEFFFKLSPRNSSPVSRFSVVASCSESSMAVSSFGGSRSFTLLIMRGFRFQVLPLVMVYIVYLVLLDDPAMAGTSHTR
ncbi:unnamed protein product [Citrullus colocynthis]|uniref:Uncharacterized protein n=1 Tax=Citrullus colocynthis TaxID=252529 RepID=A0ABP0YRN3_9ROSI